MLGTLRLVIISGLFVGIHSAGFKYLHLNITRPVIFATIHGHRNKLARVSEIVSLMLTIVMATTRLRGGGLKHGVETRTSCC